nr:variable large family protein [Borrelia nietonii]
MYHYHADTAANAKKSAADAPKAVEAVTDADILRDMVKDGAMLLNWRKKQLGMLL